MSTHSHARMHTEACAFTHTHRRARACTLAHAHAHARTHTQLHTHTHGPSRRDPSGRERAPGLDSRGALGPGRVIPWLRLRRGGGGGWGRRSWRLLLALRCSLFPFAFRVAGVIVRREGHISRRSLLRFYPALPMSTYLYLRLYLYLSVPISIYSFLHSMYLHPCPPVCNYVYNLWIIFLTHSLTGEEEGRTR